MRHFLLKTLEKAEKHIKTDVRYLMKGGFWVSLHYVIQIGMGAIITVALANILDKEQLGVYQFVMSMAGIMGLLTLSGMGFAIIRAVAQGNEGILASAVKLKLKWSIGIVLASACLAAYYYFNENIILGTAFTVIGLTVPFIESFKLLEPYLHGREAYKESVVLGLWRKPLPLIAVVGTAFVTQDVLYTILVYFISNAISYALVYMVVLDKYRPSGVTDATTLRLSKHISVMSMFSHASIHADKVLLWFMIGPVAVASFTIAQLASTYAGTLLNAFGTLILPKVSKRDLTVLQKTLPRKILLANFIMAIGAGLYIIVAPFLFQLLFPSYTESIILTQLLALSIILLPRNFYSQTLIAHNLVYYQYILKGSSSVLRVCLLFVLIAIYGIHGAIIAILLTDLYSAVLAWYLFKIAKQNSKMNER